MNGGRRYDTEQGRWQALSSRDRGADGTFYYGVRPTGAYCRPGCPSRLPRRDNVEYFVSRHEAEQSGYRPCLRCRPDGEAVAEKQRQLVERACRQIEASETPVPLEQLASRSGLSRFHFHRLFRQLVGLTPKQYGQAIRNDRFRAGLREAGSVTEAIYSAGFGSASRAYDREQDRLAMTPGAYRHGADGETIWYAAAECFLGRVLVGMTARGICSVAVGDSEDLLLAELREAFPKARLLPAGDKLDQTVRAVVAYIDQPRDLGELPLDIRGTAFQQRVWQALCRIAVGERRSYTAIAEEIGQPRAIRAVARACAANRIAVLIPCHRVVRSDGSISGYRWGRQRKQALLEHERLIADDVGDSGGS